MDVTSVVLQPVSFMAQPTFDCVTCISEENEVKANWEINGNYHSMPQAIELLQEEQGCHGDDAVEKPTSHVDCVPCQNSEFQNLKASCKRRSFSDCDRLPAHLLERSISASAVEHTNTKDVLHKKMLQHVLVHSRHSQCAQDKNTSSQNTETKLNPKSMDLSLVLKNMSVASADTEKTDKSCSESVLSPCDISVKDSSREVMKKPPLPNRSKHKKPQAKQSWLLRLFESKMFDMSMAISYIYNSKEPGVQTYIGKACMILNLI